LLLIVVPALRTLFESGGDEAQGERPLQEAETLS
jgi:hypothetical protein